MHVLQYLAVTASDEDEAMSKVERRLDEELNPGLSWYDWFVIGGGRFVDGDPYASSPNHIISTDKHGVSAIQEKVDWAISARKSEFDYYRNQVKEIDINAELDKYTGVMDYSFGLYPLSKAIDMLQGDWDFNSFFFDIETYSTNPKHMLDKLATSVVNWYLVPVDFHF